MILRSFEEEEDDDDDLKIIGVSKCESKTPEILPNIISEFIKRLSLILLNT